jgi:hypothetical protein
MTLHIINSILLNNIVQQQQRLQYLLQYWLIDDLLHSVIARLLR